jgi:hypothetical protein
MKALCKRRGPAPSQAFRARWAQRCGRAQRRGGRAGAASLRRSPRSGDSPALLDPRSHRGTRCVRFAHCASDSRDESDHEARAAHAPTTGLRCSAPQRRCACRPPAPLREPQWTLEWVHRWFFAKPWAGGRQCASAAPRSAGARGLRIAARRGVERSLSEHEHRQPAQQDAARARASSALAIGHRAPQGSRRFAPTAAVKHGRPPAHGFATLKPDRRIC